MDFDPLAASLLSIYNFLPLTVPFNLDLPIVTVPLNNFRVRSDGVQENQVHSITIQSMEVPNLNFQPIPPTSKFYSIAT